MKSDSEERLHIHVKLLMILHLQTERKNQLHIYTNTQVHSVMEGQITSMVNQAFLTIINVIREYTIHCFSFWKHSSNFTDITKVTF